MSRTKTKTIADQEKRRLVEEWDRSGLSSDAFGDARGVRGATLQAWGRAIRGPLRVQSQTRAALPALEIVEVGSARKGVEPRIELVLTGGRRLVLFGDFSPAQIADLVARLEMTR